jgi:hypothetical protein
VAGSLAAALQTHEADPAAERALRTRCARFAQEHFDETRGATAVADTITDVMGGRA